MGFCDIFGHTFLQLVIQTLGQEHDVHPWLEGGNQEEDGDDNSSSCDASSGYAETDISEIYRGGYVFPRQDNLMHDMTTQAASSSSTQEEPPAPVNAPPPLPPPPIAPDDAPVTNYIKSNFIP